MLFIVNAYGNYTSNRGARTPPELFTPSMLFHVLDTDDFVVETITGADVIQAIISGLRFANFDMLRNRVEKQSMTDLEEILIFPPFYHKLDFMYMDRLSFKLNNESMYLGVREVGMHYNGVRPVRLTMNDTELGVFNPSVPPVSKAGVRISFQYLFKLQGVWVLRFYMATTAFGLHSPRVVYDIRISQYYPFTLLFDKDFKFVGVYGQDFHPSVEPNPILAKFMMLDRNLRY